jgi:putative ATPase
MGGQATVLFVDEVHRFNKSQQDAFLPFVEDGTVVFIGATTENPSFELNSALLSRARVYTLKSLSDEDLLHLLDQTLRHPKAELHRDPIVMADEQREQLVAAADGDARKLLNLLEVAVDLAQDTPEGRVIDADVVSQLLVQSLRRFDKGGDIFYDQISALHKSVRGSSPDAALYWMVRMLEGGCDPLYIARRLVRMASEDIGNADPRALSVAMSAWDSVERLGVPEGELGLAQAVVYLASAPKSNAVYTAYKAARTLIANTPSYEVPLHLRNAPTKLMKELDYGAEYRYVHDEPEAYAAGENYFPPELSSTQLYAPVERGLEGKIKAKLEHLRERDKTSTIQRYSSDDSKGSR